METIDTVDVAKMLRSVLRQKFPKTKFRVRSERYSGGSSIDVYWTDGPNTGAVRRVCARYQGATFDGMTDTMDYHTSILSNPGGDIEEVRFGADFVQAHRTYSVAALQKALRTISERFGRPDWLQYEAHIKEYKIGGAYMEDTGIWDGNCWLEQLVWRTANEMVF